jgi:hypothetical protein
MTKKIIGEIERDTTNPCPIDETGLDRESRLSSHIDGHIAQLRPTGGLRPCPFTWDAEHGRHGVSAKRHDRPCVLPCATANLHVPVNRRVLGTGAWRRSDQTKLHIRIVCLQPVEFRLVKVPAPSRPHGMAND